MTDRTQSPEVAAIDVGDLVRLDGENFDSIVMERSGDTHVILAGWPNPSVPLTKLTLVEKFNRLAAGPIQHDVVYRAQLRQEAAAKAIASRCEHCNGTGRRPENV